MSACCKGMVIKSTPVNAVKLYNEADSVKDICNCYIYAPKEGCLLLLNYYSSTSVNIAKT